VDDRHAHRRPLQGRHRQRRDPARVTGTIVRDGYAGYTHLTDALHAWCGAHLLRDLAAFHRADPDQQMWAKAMADLLIDAHYHAQNARAAGADRINAQTLTDLRRRYLGAYTAGIRDNDNRADPLSRDAATLARRFCDHQDMILRFVVDLALPFTNYPDAVLMPMSVVRSGCAAGQGGACAA